jgi:hypothetical protein
MQLKNPLIFSLLAILLIGGSVLPAMSQTESDEEASPLELNLDKSAYDLNESIIISGQILDYVPNTRDPTLDMVKIIFLDDRGRTVSAGTYGVHSGTNWNDTPQPFVHNIMPDQAGNYKITTSVSSVMFDYGTYTVQATSYQGGKIVNTSEIELRPAPVEEVIEEEPIVFEFCQNKSDINDSSQVMSNYKKGIDVVDCVEDNNFLSGGILFVRGTVIFNDHQKVGDLPAFAEVSIPISQSLVWSGNWVTTDCEGEEFCKGIASTEKTTIDLPDITFNALPDADGSFVAIFDLPPVQFESGLYPIKVSYQGIEVEKTVRVINESTILPGEPTLIMTTDKNEYKPGETVQISGTIQNSYLDHDVTITVTTPDFTEYNCLIVECIVDSNTKIVTPEQGLIQHDFSWSYQLGSSEASIGEYIVNSETTIGNAKTSFIVTEESAITQGVSTPKKVIEKFNRISDSNILISIDEKKTQDSDLTPRVIQGSLFTAARGQEASINIQVFTSDGVCIIGQDAPCMVTDSTRKPGAIYDTVTIGETNYKIRYSGPDAQLEKFSILPESTGTAIDIQDWNVQVIKDEQPTRFYYKISYVNLE